MVDEQNTLRQITEWSEKAAEYDELKLKNDEYLIALKDAAQTFRNAITKIEGILAGSEKRIRIRTPGATVVAQIAEQTQKLMNGHEVTLESMRLDYPELAMNRLIYIFYQKLGSLEGVVKNKTYVDGHSVTTLKMGAKTEQTPLIV